MSNHETEKSPHIGQSLSNAGLSVTGVGSWCAPGPANLQSKKWLVIFDDTDLHPMHIFENETDAYLFFSKSETLGWNCYLFELASRVTPNVKLRGAALLRRPSRTPC